MGVVRVVRGKKETDYIGVSTIQKTLYDDGIDVVLRNNDGGVIKELQMPEDGRKIYIMDDEWDTRDTITWPPKDKISEKDNRKPELRVTVVDR